MRRNVVYVYPNPPGIPIAQFVASYKKYRSRRLIYGHHIFGLHERLGVEARYFTVVRQPAERAISLFRHYCRVSRNDFHEIALREGIVGLFRRNGPQAGLFSMTRDLVTSEQYTPDPEHGYATEACLTKAKANLLAYFVHVGLTEELASDIPHIEALLGVSLNVGRENVDPLPQAWNQLDDAEKAAIETHFRFDFDLYDFVKSLRRERLDLGVATARSASSADDS
jgi:hypothetical protein